jgi:hypothetical protein
MVQLTSGEAEIPNRAPASGAAQSSFGRGGDEVKDVELPEQEFLQHVVAIGAGQHELVVPLRTY